MAEFKPVFTRPRTRELEKLDKAELIKLLPKSMQMEIRRVEWAWQNIDKWAKTEVRLPASGDRVADLRFTKEDILLMFDPDPEEMYDPTMSAEDNHIHYVNSDPVIWSRIYLGMNPRIYQIVLLRDPHPRKVLRLGRRCGKTTTMAIRMLFKSYTKPGNKTLLIAPMKSHLSVTWEMIEEMSKRSPELVDEFSDEGFRKIEQPHYLIKMTNGSTIKCFTSGIRSKSHGDVIRGQEGDDIYIDEVDMMSVDDLPAFTAILRDTGRGEKTMIVATTPNGRRDMLWKFCTELSNINDKVHGRGFKEFYFPTHADMNYTPADDSEQKKLLTHNQYVHEILADFGEESIGVFLKGQIQRALDHYPDGYRYVPAGDWYQRSPFEKVVIGVDWDKFGAGTNIVVCSWDMRDQDQNIKDAGRVKVIARFEIPRSMTTLLDGVEMILNLNAQFRPDAIFMDRGYGETQLELMHEAEKKKDPRAIGMSEKVRGIAFQEAVEIIDPHTKLPVRKETKDHMITLAVRLFEQDMVIINETDIDQVQGSLSGLTKQFEQYIQVGMSIYGKPRYEAADARVGDHALDAFMLCCLAIDQNWGAFSRPDLAMHPIVMTKSLHEVVGGTTLSTKDFMRAEDHERASAQVKRQNIRGFRLNLRNNGKSIKRTIMRGR